MKNGGAADGFPLPDAALPALGPLLDGNLWDRWASSGHVFPLAQLRPAVRYVRLKPGTSCRLVVFGGTPGTPGLPPPGFVLQLYADPERARAAFGKEASRPSRTRAEHLAPFLDPTHAVVAVPYPGDRSIPGLRHAYRPHRLRLALSQLLADYPAERWRIRRALEAMDLLSYKPERRAVFRLQLRIDSLVDDAAVQLPLHVKVENSATSERSYGNLAAIHAGAGRAAAWGVPAPIGIVRRHALTAVEWIEGLPLLAAAAERGTEPFRLAGVALGGLHGLRVDLPVVMTAADEGAALPVLARDLAGLLPAERTRILRLGDRLVTGLRRLPVGARTVLHGDLHLGQALYSGGRVWLVDFDRAHLGDPAADLGSFLGHLAEAGCGDEAAGAFLEGYMSATGRAIDTRAVELWTACAIFRRGFAPFRRLDVDWPERVRGLLSKAEAQGALLPNPR